MPTTRDELPSPRGEALEICKRLGVPGSLFADEGLPARTPITGEIITHVRATTPDEAKRAIGLAQDAFKTWRRVPAPRRGELVRLFSDELRAAKDELGRLVTLETGKILSEGLGEVQEMIDISDFAIGLSRQLYGLTIASERLSHRMMETWHPLGPTGIITSFNFPVAVWSWNAALALVCGNACIWKPSEKTPLTALATQALFEKAAAGFGDAPDGLSVLLIGGRELGEILAEDIRVPLISATGSTAMGRAVGGRLARRFARSILELSGNNAAVVAPSADLDLAVQAIAFAAIGTTGQRCTTLRRLFVHEDIYDRLVPHLCKVYSSVPIGDPRDEDTLMGPLIDGHAYEAMQRTLNDAKAAKACVSGGSRVLEDKYPAGFYVSPALVELDSQADFVKRETFAPILYCLRYQSLETAIAEQNNVRQGLASSIFTQDLREAETFLSAIGSDCGIANVNIGPSGAEIGGAFGGEKETGGGREAGSDAWKNYMRRATNTINYCTELPLAQGVRFTVES
jgi:L-aminoadipate-semialdehyde dehydrogenase